LGNPKADGPNIAEAVPVANELFGQTDVIEEFAGEAFVNYNYCCVTFLPGAVSDNMTSIGGNQQNNNTVPWT
jgi:hypothetical protein